MAEPAPDPFTLAVQSELKRDVQRTLQRLVARRRTQFSPDMAFIVRHRFGLNTDDKTLAEIGALLVSEGYLARTKPLSQERVRQREARALRMLRHPSALSLLYPYTW